MRDRLRSPRRSLLFAPGSDEHMLEKALSVGADAVIADLEDAVAPMRKEEARAHVVAWLSEDAGGTERVVRINPPGTPWFEDDLAAVHAEADTLLLPKTESAKQVAGLAGGEVPVIALIETAAGVLAAADVAAASPQVEALCFGHVDFARDLDLFQPDPREGLLLHARCQVVLAAKAAGKLAIDTVHPDVRNTKGFEAATADARTLGFDGKLCIHPIQVTEANRAFTPRPDEIARAERIVAAWERAGEEAVGAFALDGEMIDAPVVAACVRLLERAARS
jgi:citrate lyase subunit beta/citryl-CoA lyase